MSSSLLAEARLQAASTGLNLFGIVDAERFDAWQPLEQRTMTLRPDCRTVIVLGSGGRVAARGPSEPAVRLAHIELQDVIAYERAAAQRLAAMLLCRSVSNRLVEPVVGQRLNFVRLAEAAGFGTVSPVSGLLLHPEFGPWVRVRAALLLDGRPFGPVADASITDRFQPCCSCAKPCLTACPVSVHDGLGNQDLARCVEHRHLGGCASGCGSRRACPIGAEHRDQIGPDVHRYTHRILTTQRALGSFVWRFVPRFLRGMR
jgi:epoxyqueuosine reductase QueG